jgi:nitroreductase
MIMTRAADGFRTPCAREFPFLGSPEDQLRFCLQYAVLAPSNHNTQPWRFRLDADEVELWADRSRALPAGDPRGRELAMSCGAALRNLRVAVEAFGGGSRVEILPDPARKDLLARLRLAGRVAPDPETKLLFHAIPHRRTNREAFEDWPTPAEVCPTLQDAALEEGAWLVPLEQERKTALADLVAEGHRFQLADRAFQSELSDWTRNDGAARDPDLLRTFDWSGSGRAARDRQLALGSPILAVLGTGKDDPSAWMAAGQALENVLLWACVLGLQASFLNQPVEVDALRPKVQAVVGCGGHPQIVLRLGYGPAVPATPRLGLDQVLMP